MGKAWSRVFLFIFGLYSLSSCEQEDKLVGAGILGNGNTVFEEQEINVEVFNLFEDSIRSDRKALNSRGGVNLLSGAVVGVYDEPIFGKTKSAFFVQPRLSALNPKFGQDPQLDSIVLSIPVLGFVKDTLSVKKELLKTTYVKKVGDECQKVTDTILTYREFRKFELDSIYGNKEAKMTLQVHQVSEPMLSIDTAFYSKRSFKTGDLLGEKEIDKYAFTEYVYNLNLRAKVDSARKNTILQDSVPSIKVKLTGLNRLVQNEILKKPSQLSNQAYFVNKILKGLKISVGNDQGFLLGINPSKMQLNIYYNRVNEDFKDANHNGIDDREENCDVKVLQPRLNATYQLSLGGAYNVLQSEIQNERGSIDYTTQQSSNLYLEGMGGSFAKLHIDDKQLSDFKTTAEKNKWAIIEAYLRVYPNHGMQKNLALPPYLYLYNYTKKSLIDDYVGNNRAGQTPFIFADISRKYNNKKGYYQLKITRLIKNIVEENATNPDLAINIGNYYNPGQSVQYQPPYYWATDQVQNPYRLIAHGENSSDKSLKLIIRYTKKKS